MRRARKKKFIPKSSRNQIFTSGLFIASIRPKEPTSSNNECARRSGNSLVFPISVTEETPKQSDRKKERNRSTLRLKNNQPAVNIAGLKHTNRSDLKIDSVILSAWGDEEISQTKFPNKHGLLKLIPRRQP